MHKPICECAPDCDHYEYDFDSEYSLEGSEDGDDY
jgi:hypothetical protein